MKLFVVFAGISGVLLASAGGIAYAQSTTQSSQANCGSMMNRHQGMGMMGGMGQYGSMAHECRTQMSQQDMGQCQTTMTSTIHYSMMGDENLTRACWSN